MSIPPTLPQERHGICSLSTANLVSYLFSLLLCCVVLYFVVLCCVVYVKLCCVVFSLSNNLICYRRLLGYLWRFGSRPSCSDGQASDLHLRVGLAMLLDCIDLE